MSSDEQPIRELAQRQRGTAIREVTPLVRIDQPNINAIVNTRQVTTTGYLIVFGFLLSFVAWAASAPMSNAAIASGIVSFTGNNKPVQHLDGGIVSQVLVREGDLVTRNQPLIQLNQTELQTQFDNLLLKLMHAEIEHARWQAEFDNSTGVDYPSASRLGHFYPTEALALTIQTQNTLFTTRRANTEQALLIFDDRILQMENEQQAAARRLRALIRQDEFVSAELEKYVQFEAEGLVTRSRVFELESNKNSIALDVNEARTNRTLINDKISQLNRQREELLSSKQQTAAENLSRLQADIDTTEPQLINLQIKLDRQRVVAPIDGTVINLSINSPGSVISGGQVLMELVPVGEKLLVESRVSPRDRDTIDVGQQAQIRFSAFDMRSTQPIQGVVTVISADRIIDPVSALPYYKTTIEPQFSTSDTIKASELFPGMEAEVLIITGEQTLFQYLLGPVTRSFNRALRES